MMTPHITVSLSNPIRNERGMALIVALMSMLLLTALGLGLMMTTMTETMIANNYRESGEALYAADAGVERVMQDLLTIPDWNRILHGTNSRRSSTARRAARARCQTAARSISRGDQHDELREADDLLRGRHGRLDGRAALRRRTTRAGSSSPTAPLDEIIETGTIVSPMYVAVWIADDRRKPTTIRRSRAARAGRTRHSADPCRGVRAHGAQTVIEVTVAKTDTTELERGYTGQRGQDEQNRRARKAAVQTPGKALTRSDMGRRTAGGFVERKADYHEQSSIRSCARRAIAVALASRRRLSPSSIRCCSQDISSPTSSWPSIPGIACSAMRDATYYDPGTYGTDVTYEAALGLVGTKSTTSYRRNFPSLLHTDTKRR